MDTYTTVTSISRAADRKRLAEDIRKALEPLEGVSLDLDLHDRELRLVASHDLLKASLWVWPGNRREHEPLVSWHGAQRPLAYLPGVWGADINRFHFHKATSFPRDYDDMIRHLVDGFQAVIDGSAFRDEETER